MQQFAREIVSIADASLGGLRGRSALLIGPEEQRYSYASLLQQAGVKTLYQEESSAQISSLLPQVQLLMHLLAAPLIPAASIAKGCVGRRIPLLIFDLAHSTSIDELAGLLPPVCLYTPKDLSQIISRAAMKVS